MKLPSTSNTEPPDENTAMAAGTHSGEIEKIAAARPWFPDEDIAEILPKIERILKSGWLILGEETRAFEEQFSRYVGTEHAVAVSSCTAALQIALRFFGIKNREVVLPTNNFVGVVSAVLYEGGLPVLADMDPNTFCLDVTDTLARITSKTAGVIVVHIAGLIPPEIDRLREACDGKGLFLIEDAAHAAGAAIGGRKAGSLADVGCFSFYPTKILTTGTGGMLTTDNAELARYARSVRHHGFPESGKYMANLGSDWCMSEVHAVLGQLQLARLDRNIAHRQHLVHCYRRELEGADWLTIPDIPEQVHHAFYKFPVLLREDIDRDLFRHTLADRYRIEMGMTYDPPCHLQPVLDPFVKAKEGDLPRAESALCRQICLPIHAAVTDEQVHTVTRAMKEVARGFNATGTAPGSSANE